MHSANLVIGNSGFFQYSTVEFCARQKKCAACVNDRAGLRFTAPISTYNCIQFTVLACIQYAWVHSRSRSIAWRILWTGHSFDARVSAMFTFQSQLNSELARRNGMWNGKYTMTVVATTCRRCGAHSRSCHCQDKTAHRKRNELMNYV